MPYQLHCALPTELAIEELTLDAMAERLLDDDFAELATTDELEIADELANVEELTLELIFDELLDAGELELVDTIPSQTAPLTTGTSATLLPLVPWNPNSAVCPTARAPFQLALVAVYGFEPVKVVFQAWEITSPLVYFQFTVQPFTGAVPVLVMRIVPPNQLEPWLLTMYWQLAEALTDNADKSIDAPTAAQTCRKSLEGFFLRDSSSCCRCRFR